MPAYYKISGNLDSNARVIVINENTWDIEYNQSLSSGVYVVGGLLVSGTKYVTAITDNQGSSSYAHVQPIYYYGVGDRGVFGGGQTGSSTFYATMDYITISTVGNALAFGSLPASMTQHFATSNGDNGRGIWGGGYTGATIYYATILTSSSAASFGTLNMGNRLYSGTSNGTSNRGVVGGGQSTNLIEYITISTPGNSQSFGQLTQTRWTCGASTSNATNNRGVWGGGYDGTSTYYNTIDYITITSIGAASAFGQLTVKRYSGGSTSNGTNNRGIWFGGNMTAGAVNNTIDYVTLSTTGNATSFGNTITKLGASVATSNGTNDRGIMGGGTNISAVETNIIEYITISTLGNSIDFGDLTQARNMANATSNA